MKAKEAKLIASQYSIDKSQSQLNEIIEIVREAALKGECHCWYYGSVITEIVRNALLSDGYTVGQTIFDRNELLTEISW